MFESYEQMLLFIQSILDMVIILAFITAFIILVVHACAKLDHSKERHDKTPHDYAILIPARNESHVIRNILESIKNQTYKMDMADTYVIVESIEDPTVEICKEYGASYFVRTELEGRRRKGYALDECLKDIFSKGKKYDAYFIFDADNILAPNYIELMNETYNDGFDIAIGYRNSTNWNKNTVAACSALTFTMINEFGNKRRLMDGTNVVVSGTGYYIKSYILEELNGFPFTELTEDYEITMYSRMKNYKTFYNVDAWYYDEQPENIKLSNKQRQRWVKGYFEVRKKYKEDLKKAKKADKGVKARFNDAGILPYVLLILVFVGYIVGSYIIDIKTGKGWFCAERLLIVIFYLYLLLSLFSLTMLCNEKKKAGLTGKTIFKATLFNPIFLSMYVHIALSLLGKKEIGWDEIKHKGSGV